MAGRSLTTRYASAGESPGFLLWHATNRWQAAQRAALKPFGLTHVQFVLLASLAWFGADAPVTQRELAGHAGTDPMMTSQVVRALERRRLLTRSPYPGDGRAHALAVTRAGRDLANRAIVAVEQCDERFFETLGAEVPHFARMLGALRHAQVVA